MNKAKDESMDSAPDTFDTQEIPEKQHDLPVTFRSVDHGPVTLGELLKKEGPAAQSLSQLSPEEHLELASERIKRLPDFEVEMVGLGHLNQRRALEEIENQTEAGRLLAEIESRTIRRLLRRAGRSDLV